MIEQKRNSMDRKLFAAAAAFAAGAAGLAAEIYRELHTFRVVRYRIASAKLKGIERPLRIAFLSDLHNYVYRPQNRPLLESIKAEKPDLVLIGGDMLVGRGRDSYRPAAELVCALARLFPVYYANGNHEKRMKENPEDYAWSYECYKKTLEKAGVVFLENLSEELRFGGCRVRLTGLELPASRYRHFGTVKISEEEVQKYVGKPDGEAYQILLAHDPSHMKQYIGWGADLVLSGHLHGGIVRLPGIGGVITPSLCMFPKYSGEHSREGGTDIVVSKGLGTHTVHLRLFNPAEVVMVELRGADGA